MRHKWNKTPSGDICKDARIKCIYCGKYRWKPSPNIYTADKVLDAEFCVRRTLALSNIMHLIDCCTDTFVQMIDCLIYETSSSLPGTSPPDAVSHRQVGEVPVVFTLRKPV